MIGIIFEYVRENAYLLRVLEDFRVEIWGF